MITETSAFGSQAARSAWLSSSLATIKALRTSGVPVIGYTWFPLFTIDRMELSHRHAAARSLSP